MLRIKRKKRERGGWRAGRNRERARWGSIAGDEELVGVARPAATVHQNTNGCLREREKVAPNPSMALARPGERTRGTLHGRRHEARRSMRLARERTPKHAKIDRDVHGGEVELTSAINLGGDGSVRRFSRGGHRRRSSLRSLRVQDEG